MHLAVFGLKWESTDAGRQTRLDLRQDQRDKQKQTDTTARLNTHAHTDTPMLA